MRTACLFSGSRRLRIGAAVLLGCAARLASGASAFDFDVWMRAIDKDSVAVQKSLQRRDADAARMEAARLEKLYTSMEDYFAQAGQAADAVKLSADGRALAASIGPAIDAGDFAAGLESAQRLARACNDCHDTYKPFK